MANPLCIQENAVLVRFHSPTKEVQEEYFLLDENGKLDLSEVGLLFGSAIFEADSSGNGTIPLECDSAEVSIKSFSPGQVVDICSPGELVHGGNDECGKCETRPIVGPRFFCTECVYSFSLCSSCFASHFRGELQHEHGPSFFVKLDKMVFSNMWLGGATLLQTVLNAFNNYGPLPCIGYQDGDKLAYMWLSYFEVKKRFTDFASGLHKLKPNKLGLYTTNRAEWIIADLACVYTSCVSVYIPYPMDTESLVSLINDAEMDAIICESSLQILEITARLPLLRFIIQINSISPAEVQLASTRNIHLVNFVELELSGSSNKIPPIRSLTSSLSSIVYTSGSTGSPKGVMFTASAMNASLKSSITVGDAGKIVLLEYLPLSHTRAAYRHCCLLGGQYALYNKGLSDLFSVAQVVNPTRFRGVPLVWNKLYMEYQASLVLAMKTGLDEAEAKKVVLAKFSGILGSRIARVSTGSAPTSAAVANFLQECFKEVVDAYGCTEVGSISANQRVVRTSEFKIVDCDELGYRETDQPYPRGEVAVRTQDMSSGYYKNEAANLSSFTPDGYFLTGDIAELRDGQLIIIDRKKNFFKLANGKFVRCEHLETIFMKSDCIHQIFITGDPLRDYVVAVVVPSLAATQEDIKKQIMGEISKIATEYQLANHEVPKALIIEQEPFSVDNGTLTPTFKKARVALNARYKSQVDAIYAADSENLRSTKDILKGILAQTLNYPLDTSDENSNNSGYFGNTSDSLSKVLLVSQIKNIFSKDVPIGTAFSSLSLDDLAKLVLSPHNEPQEEKFHKDLDLPLPDITTERPPNFDIFEKTDRPTTLFVTGATGFVGAFVLAEFLRRTSPSVRFICLVRNPANSETPKKTGHEKSESPNKTKSTSRVFETFEKYRMEADPSVWERVEEISGDLEAENFGLDEDAWDRLAQRADAIVHCAASVNWAHSYQELRAANVLGTLAVLKLATQRKTKPILYVSTLSVSRDFNDTNLPSADEFTRSKPFSRKDGYVMSKWMAEHLVRKTAAKGLPVLVVRPGMVTGHSISGAVHEGQFVARLLRGIASMRTAPRSRAILTDITPVDFVSAACAHLFRKFMLRPSVFGNDEVPSFHLWNDKYASFDDVTECLSARGLPIEMMTYDDWITKIRESDSKRNSLYALLPFFPKKNQEDMIGIRNQQQARIHEICGHETEICLDKSVNFMLSRMLSFLIP
eukprot:Phypoly_transcript_01099.p1 GENE.Phypoly_transcript_01099~~Phypoly_transcript_01099.p1  ORF type:complete len:1206 (+),score=157.70 Phypoly_transcript_01099:60-3677(+)